jgi:two-component system chemotaxis response regulator CheB
MTHRDIVAIGGSAGGIQALVTLMRELPSDLPAAFFVVVHVTPFADSQLPEILEKAGPLPVAHARHGEPIEPGRVYIAPPNRHLLVRNGWIELSLGPRENHTRPAIDPLFRTAARAYGPRVAGIVLSGALYDGALGLMAIKTRGGLAIVQDPTEAAVESMPRSALQLVNADFVLPVADIATVVTDLAVASIPEEGASRMIDDEERIEAVIDEDFVEQTDDGRTEETTVYTCPDCGGVLWQAGSGPVLSFRCHIGHAYAPELLLGQKSDEVEAALWSSLRLLKEKATLSRQLATRSRTFGNGTVAERIEERAQRDEQYAAAIHELLEAIPSPLDQAVTVTGAVDED